MRLTDIVKALFESNGDEIFIGETKLEGIVLDKEDGTLIGSTIVSNIDSSGLRISAEKSNPFISSTTRLVATANMEFDSYSWEVTSGTATFVNGISTGNTVYITDNVASNNIVTLTAISGENEKMVQTTVNFITGFFSGVKIIGVNLIDSSDPVRYILNSDPEPDSVSWSISGGGSLSNGQNQMEKYVTADETGDDINIVATLHKTGYNDEEVTFAIAVDKCVLSGGSATVERPVIRQENGWTIDSQGSVLISPFHGINSASLVRYQIDNVGGYFTPPLADNQVSYAERFSIDINSLQEGTYSIRVKSIDNLGNESLWSDSISFIIDLSQEVLRPSSFDLLFQEFALGSNARNSLVRAGDGTWHGNMNHADGWAVFDGSSYISLSMLETVLPITFSMTIETTDTNAGNGQWNVPQFIGCATDGASSNDFGVGTTSGNLNVFSGVGEEAYHNTNHFIADGNPHDIMVVYGYSKISVHCDGALIVEYSKPNGGALVRDVYIAKQLPEGGIYYNGKIKNMRMFKGELTIDDFNEIIAYDNNTTYSYLDNISHYWAMNTQNPKDIIGGMNGVSHFCELINGVGFDVSLLLNGNAYIENPPFSNSYSSYTVSASFMVEGSTNSDGVVLGINNENGVGNILLVIINGLTLNILSYNNQYDYGSNYESYTIEPNIEYTVIVAGKRVFVNGALIYTLSGQNPISAGDRISFGMEYDDNLSIGNYFKGYIYEAAIFPFILSDDDVFAWTSKSKRPVGGEKQYALPCAAVDKPVILNNSGSRIHLTKYFGAKPFNKTEYQIFNDYELTYDTPLFQTLTTEKEILNIDKSISRNTYKVRVRYYDIDNNTSQWSRPALMNIYFIPDADIEFMLTEDKDSTGLTNVSQVGTPTIENGGCHFDSLEYFSFDRVTFDSGALSFWVKFDNFDTTNGGLHTMIAGGNNTDNKSYIWYSVSNSQIRIVDANEAEVLYSNTFSPSTGEWHNIIIEIDNVESRIYIDTTFMGTGTSESVLIDNLGAGYIGDSYDFLGSIRGFRKFPNVLTEDERIAIYQEFD